MDYCYLCLSDRHPHLMMICDLCDYTVAHTYCAGFDDFPRDWVCEHCLELIDHDLEGDDEESSEQESEVSEDYYDEEEDYSDESSSIS